MRIVELLDHPGYRVRDDGVVQSDLLQGSKLRKRTGVWRDINPTINKLSGYAYVDLRTGKRRNWSLSVLVARTFIGPPLPGQECRHKDGNRLNNRVENLCYGSHSENMQDAVLHGTIKRGVKQERSKLTDQKVREIRKRNQYGEKQSFLAREYGLSSSVVSEICTRKAWKHVK